MNSYSTSWWSLLLIYRHRKDEMLSWPCSLTYSGRFITHINGYPSAAGLVQTSESSSVRDWRSTTEPPNQPNVIRKGPRTLLHFTPLYALYWALAGGFRLKNNRQSDDFVVIHVNRFVLTDRLHCIYLFFKFLLVYLYIFFFLLYSAYSEGSRETVASSQGSVFTVLVLQWSWSHHWFWYIGELNYI